MNGPLRARYRRAGVPGASLPHPVLLKAQNPALKALIRS